MVTVVPRDDWGARRPTSRRGIRLPVRDLWLHHTAGYESGPAGMRSIQRYHQDIRGWADIAYSWVYDPRSRTFYEGRGAGVAGAHTQGHNSTSHALCVMGNFDQRSVPDTLIVDLGRFAAWHRQYGPGRFTGGHRDVGTTSCPGSNLYRAIGDINAAADEGPDDMTPEQERKLDQAHAALARIDLFLQLSGLMNPDGSPRRYVGKDLQETRLGIRALAADAGLPTRHDPPDEVGA